MCESDDGQDDLMSRSTGMCGNDEVRAILLFSACRPGSVQSTGPKAQVIDPYYTVPVL